MLNLTVNYSDEYVDGDEHGIEGSEIEGDWIGVIDGDGMGVVVGVRGPILWGILTGDGPADDGNGICESDTAAVKQSFDLDDRLRCFRLYRGGVDEFRDKESHVEHRDAFLFCLSAGEGDRECDGVTHGVDLEKPADDGTGVGENGSGAGE